MFWADLPRVSGAIDGSSRGTCPVLGSGGLGSQVLPSVQRDLAGKVPSHLDSRHLPRAKIGVLLSRWRTCEVDDSKFGRKDYSNPGEMQSQTKTNSERCMFFFGQFF